ncbi:MAG: hypothetical protein AC479_05940 [miscellaneous Crenarchaeota group-6 archaeon AD8-1]|nr:MAG: hypothetical protein AC479_05940 [miscellaneous Crenarchaeota group-6 archaeon AD8-1]
MAKRKTEKGFKQTEVGAIPEDWDIDLIENLASITTGSKNTQDKIEEGINKIINCLKNEQNPQ